jgi:hypothetical protein
MEVPLLGQGKSEKESGEELPYREVKTAFLVYLGADNSIHVSPDINLPVVCERQPDPHDIWLAVTTIKNDIEKQELALLTAQHVLSAQMQMAARIQDAQATQQVLGRIGNVK